MDSDCLEVAAANPSQFERARYFAARALRRMVLVVFFPAWTNDAGLMGLPTGLLVANGLAQRLFGINRKASFPVHFSSRVTDPKKLKLGGGVARYLAISGGCYVQTANGVEIGTGTMVAPGVKIVSANHDVSRRDQHVAARGIKIGERCWLGANTVVLPGVTIGSGAVVGAGSVVAKDLPPNCVAVGSPAAPLPRTDSIQ